MRRRLLVIFSLAAFSCWQPPDLPPADPPVAPSEAELLASRPYTLNVPSVYSDAYAWPLLISLHGYGEDGESTAKFLGLPNFVQVKKIFFAAPDAMPDARQNRAWHPSPVHSPPWDVEYLTAIIHDAKARYRIDPKRVYVVGFSQGAHMAHRMGCDVAADVVGLVAIAGQGRLCTASEPVSALAIHGTEDEVIGYDGDVQNFPPDATVPSVHQSIDMWARMDHCQEPIEPSTQTLDLVAASGNETTVEAYSGCDAGTAVVLWTMNGVGHMPTFNSTFAATIYDFLDGHRRQ